MSKKEPAVALQSARVALEHEVQMSPEQRNELGTEFGLPDVLWVIGAGCNTRDQIRAWLVDLGGLSEVRRAAMRNSHIAPESAWMVFEKLLLQEQNLPTDARDWASLRAFLHECQELALKANIPLLEASAFRAEQSVCIVHLARPEDGDRLGREHIEQYPSEGVEAFLVAEGTGVPLIRVNRWDLALPWFNRAAKCKFDGLDSLRMQSQLRRAEALFRAGQDASTAFADAEMIAQTSENLDDLDIVLCLAEKAMWQWLIKDWTGCFYTWDRALELIIGQDRRSTRWKNLFVLMGNHTSFFQDAIAGEALSPGRTPPMMGLYLRDYDVSNLYSEGFGLVCPSNNGFLRGAPGRI